MNIELNRCKCRIPFLLLLFVVQGWFRCTGPPSFCLVRYVTCFLPFFLFNAVLCWSLNGHLHLKREMDLNSSKWKSFIFLVFSWRSPGSPKGSNREPFVFFHLLYSDLQDHALSWRFYLSPLLSLVTQKWKTSLFWVLSGIVWGLVDEDRRTFDALSTGTAWIS